MKRAWTISGKLLVTAIFLFGIHGTALAQQEEVNTTGQREFQTTCVTCHGPGGKGDGIISDALKTKPADLTQLSKNNNGEFPFWETYATIDGRTRVIEHGTTDMPIWGDHFREQEIGKPDSLARGRILSLTFYLQSIQEK
jgi:mono/diheme cytochrome c family protein